MSVSPLTKALTLVRLFFFNKRSYVYRRGTRLNTDLFDAR